MNRTPWLPASILAGVGILAAVPAQTPCDYSPVTPLVVLDTGSTTILTSCGPRLVRGGVFVFRNVTIPAGVRVQGVGPKPMVWIVYGDFTVNGELSVDGGDGAVVNTLQSASFPTAGGIGGPAAGDGGLGSPSIFSHSPRGQDGAWIGGLPSLGGRGGRLALATGPDPCERGSGGGGGTFATAGDPWYPVRANGTSFVQQLGFGGYGCLGFSGSPSRSLPGGDPGVSPFADLVAENDFFGLGVDVFRQRLIFGELSAPLGGAGGGGGGDRTTGGYWAQDNKGGGGGGGGGALVVLAAGKIEVGPQGRISANGGNGGGGEQAGSNNQGGGGGGGSGGMIVMESFQRIVLNTHGETYANGDYDFVVSADGGVGRQGAFAGIAINGKYPPPSTPALWDQNPTGGFGGLGVIELITPVGTNGDGTNTILDDNIQVVKNGQLLTGAQKQRYLAWRGWPDQNGVPVDDFGNPTNVGANEGDIRPTPILLPVVP